MKRLSYRAAGVNIARGDALVRYVKKLTRARRRDGVVAGVGGFAAMTRIPAARGRVPLLVSGTDSVGTKLKVAFATGRHDTVGIDCVAMCANDVAVQGAAPLFFLDYFGVGRLELRVGRAVLRGVVAGCDDADCPLIGGETAELPGLYAAGEYDLVGFCVGGVAPEEVVNGRRIKPGDVVIGVGSTGLHSNGYSLVNRVLLDPRRRTLERRVPELGCSLAEELLRPTRIYVRTIRRLLRAVPVLGMAHITGGGLPGNLPRVLPRGLGAVIEAGTWPVPPVFGLVQRLGRVRDEEMLRTFNMGIGLAVVVGKSRAEEALKCLLDGGDRAAVVGRIVRGRPFRLA